MIRRAVIMSLLLVSALPAKAETPVEASIIAAQAGMIDIMMETSSPQWEKGDVMTIHQSALNCTATFADGEKISFTGKAATEEDAEKSAIPSE